ncbi:multicopper oxidase domain-containing protein [Corynebacterium comes]|uniref:Copper-containing nitrite reductase n=1 Tax=Corynebacterium comes TaxID=2675218 RepID=A0A6B8VMM2_9CORY|nr:multicopper oxidase domain-containing protein [Corynebacterium comes]QGU04349.1 Copper-containing nitrite reductase precursor [Corynebacterium comes]
MTLPVGPPTSGHRPPPETAKDSDWVSWLVIGLAIAAVVVLGVTLTTNTGAERASAPAAVAQSGDTVTETIRIEGMSYHPNRVEIPAGSRLVLELSNEDNQPHDLTLNGFTTELIGPGETATFDAGVFTADTEGWCTVAGHRAQGMIFNVVVTGAAAGPAATAGPGHDMPAGTGQVSGGNPFAEVPGPATRLSADLGDEAWFDPVLGPAPTGTVHELEFNVTEKIREVAPGHRQVQWLFNGQAPGPTLRGRVGDTFRITLRNDGTMGHSVDFHAGEVSPDAPMATIAPGESLVYEFVARRWGIWMYHCATAPMSLHIANGMAGAVIIDPPAGLDDVDHEYALVGHEIFLGPEDTGADADRVSAGRYDLAGFNGFPNQYDLRPIEINAGERARFWVLNVGPDNPLSFHIVGAVFDTVFSEGEYSVRNGLADSTGAQALPLLPAQGGFVEVTFEEPGTYTFVNHIMTDAEKGQHGSIIVR